MIRERDASAQSGGFMVLLLLVVLGLSVFGLIAAAGEGNVAGVLGAVLIMVLTLVGFVGLTIVNPNESQVVQLFGNYAGTL